MGSVYKTSPLNLAIDALTHPTPDLPIPLQRIFFLFHPVTLVRKREEYARNSVSLKCSEQRYPLCNRTSIVLFAVDDNRGRGMFEML